MRQVEFEHRHAAHWQRVEQWLAGHESPRARKAAAKARKAAAAPDPVPGAEPLTAAQWPAAFRDLCNQLALARDRQYSTDLIERINRLVLRGHHILYSSQVQPTEGFLGFLVAGFPRLVRAQAGSVWVSAALFFLPFFLLFALIQFEPGVASLILSPEQMSQYENMYSPDSKQLGMRESDTNFQMFGVYIWNNVRIGFQTFAGGVFLGLGSLFFLLYNGVVIGATVGHLTQVGLGQQIGSFIAGHSAMELIAIVISGAAGLKLGHALVAPGRRSRKAALLAEGEVAMRLMGGAAVMFFIAALIEAFWSPHQWPSPWPKYLVGAVFWILTLAYLFLAGRRRAA